MRGKRRINRRKVRRVRSGGPSVRGGSFVNEVVGTFTREKFVGYVYPAAKRKGFPVFIPKGKAMGAKPGDSVVARVTKQPRGRVMAEGDVTEIISRSGERAGDMRALARAHGIIPEFPKKALLEAKAVSEEFPFPEDVIRSRRDLRGETIFTIDGADAKDFDDAVSIRRSGGGYFLGVHIADVTHYVKEDGALDREALRRGTSVYLPGFVVPMLPEPLSNGICSLNEGVDRLTLTADMEVDEQGKVVHHEIYESVIRSRARLVYDDVSDFLEGVDFGSRASLRSALPGMTGGGSNTRHDTKDAGGGPNARRGIPADEGVRSSLLLMKELADVLTAARDARGSIDFDISEAEITTDGDGAPTHIAPRPRRAANRLIEEFMVLANEAVATEYFRKQRPFVYRVHAKPDPDKMRELAEFLRGFDLRIGRDPGGVRPLDLARVLKRVSGKPEENLISEVLLRSMQKAEYSPDSLGHFGLALRHYCHFTSPIRRYPDLFVHRVVKESLHGRMTARRLRDLRGRVAKAAHSSSMTEQTAVEAEREADRAKMAEYMSSRIGESFPAVISGITSFGLFVELENTIQGLVRMRDLDDDYYEHSEGEYLLRGRLSGRELRLGDRLAVTVKSVDVANREINFVEFVAVG